MRRSTVPGAVRFFGGVGERQVRVIASDATRDRIGDILEPDGVELGFYRKNPIVLAQHDTDQPIARCAAIASDGRAVVALVEFPPEGTSARSDEYLRLMKTGVISAVSVGFLPLEREILPDGQGWRYTRWELLELSCVSVPANPSAIVTEKSLRAWNAKDAQRRVNAWLARRTLPRSRSADLARAEEIKQRAIRRGILKPSTSAAEDHARSVEQERQARRAAVDAAMRVLQW